MAEASRIIRCEQILAKLHETRVKCNQAKRVIPFHGRLLSLDPGETTGFASWRSDPDKIVLEFCGQLNTPNIDAFLEESQKHLPDPRGVNHVVFERYAVYSWKTQQHANSDVPTLRIIGAIEAVCAQNNVTRTQQTAQVAKGFVTDDFLRRFGVWQKGVKHARDAIRHGIYYMFFGPPKD